MAEHPIQGLMNVTMEKIHQMVDSNTIIGKPITTESGNCHVSIVSHQIIDEDIADTHKHAVQ